MKNLKNRKGYVKTLEAVIAIVLSFLFITLFIPSKAETEERQPDLDVLDALRQNPDFRQCVIAENYSCINATFESYYPGVVLDYNYRFNISTDPKISGVELPIVNIHAESMLIAGNDTYARPKVLRLYYWLK